MDGVKVDVEGAERLVLEGAEKALAEKRIALMQIEWSAAEVQTTLGERRDRVGALLTAAGYELHRPDSDGRLHHVGPNLSRPPLTCPPPLDPLLLALTLRCLEVELIPTRWCRAACW